MKKLLCIVLALGLILGMSTSVFAETTASMEEELSIMKLNSDSYLLSDGEQTAVMQIEETDSFAKVTINENETENYFYVDKKEETMYSSYTKKTIKFSDSDSDSAISPMAAGNVVSSKTYKISYKKLANVVSDTSDKFSVASAIITLIAIQAGVSISTGATALIAIISISFSTIIKGIKGASSSHGIKVVVNKVKIKRHQGGNFVTAYRYVIASVGTY